MSVAYAQFPGIIDAGKRAGVAPDQSNPEKLLISKRPHGEGSALEALLKGVEDLSALSPELLERALHERCWYHITPFRSAIVRALDIPPAARILEVGCGGGALTRYLGERGFHVVALETSEELAECARTRCKGMSNVEVVSGFLENVVDDKRFDFVICIDPVLVQSEYFDPGVQLLSMCKKMLKPTGTLVLAVGNTLHSPGGSHLEPSADQIRGKGASLDQLKHALTSSGFSSFESYLSFPHHAAPRMLVDARVAREQRVQWLPLVKELYRCSELATSELDSWWRAVHSEQLEHVLAPGWLVLAHAHAVHAVLWKGAPVKQFCLTSDEQPAGERVSEKGCGVHSMRVVKHEILPALLEASQPYVNSVKDYKYSLVAADGKIAELADRERQARVELSNAEDTFKSQLQEGKEALRVREAELDLVLKQYHSVGAMCQEMREEGRKLQGMVEEIRRRYLASEEWGSALADRVAEAETELQEVKSSWGYRMAEKFRALLRRR